jgi:hypothetical protein
VAGGRLKTAQSTGSAAQISADGTPEGITGRVRHMGDGDERCIQERALQCEKLAPARGETRQVSPDGLAGYSGAGFGVGLRGAVGAGCGCSCSASTRYG